MLTLLALVQRGVGHQLDLHLRVTLGQFGHQGTHPGVDHRVHHPDADPPDLGPVSVQ
ncbi:hypothetical protein D9M69_582450 [compost metagenome]